MPAESAAILIVDDHRAVREELAFQLGYDGFATREAGDGPTALQLAADPGIALVLLDVKLPGLDGLEVLSQLKQARPELPVVMISGHGDLDTAVLAVRRGAYDFLQKPFAADRLLLSVRNALRSARLHDENQALRKALAGEHELLGHSEPMVQVRNLVQKLAPTQVPVLITGENGTGKELVARQLHLQSPRGDRPFVALNCAAIPAELVESELFGHEKGAFTGANSARSGAFEQADTGTLFLDEVGDMPLPMQAKLLRTLQERTVQRLGGQAPKPVDVRVVAATNQDLERMVADKTFREDLYYRLHVVRVHLPPLRERPGDVEQLAQHFLASALSRHGLQKRRLVPAALAWLAAQPWPGNVRQLRNAIERACALGHAPELQLGDFPPEVRGEEPAVLGAGGDGSGGTFQEMKARAIAELESSYVEALLKKHQGNVTHCSEEAGMARSAFQKLMTKYGIRSADFRG
jgi:DNA-binding NtrC family response regulator